MQSSRNKVEEKRNKFLERISRENVCTFKATGFRLGYKWQNGCDIDEEETEVMFIKGNHGKHGILRSSLKNEKKIFVYYNESDDFKTEKDYEFPYLLPAGDIWSNKDDDENIKVITYSLIFILQDIVFEDYCHYGRGFMIKYSEF